MAGVTKINHKGKPIYFADHKGSQGDDVVKNQEQMLKMIKDSGDSDALNLTDMTGVFATSQVHGKMRNIGDEILKYSKKAAVVGMTNNPAKKVLISTYMTLAGKSMKAFDTVEDAKDWLVS